MARIAFILLCHRDVDGIVRQARTLTAEGDFISIHFDARAGAAPFAALRAALADNPRVTFARRRVACGWGEWSLVAATLEALRAAAADFPEATHFYMLSGDCAPVKSAAFAHALLDSDACDWIESFDFLASGWIKTGIREERLIYRHWFNERGQKRLFYASLALQQRLGLARPTPAGLRIMIGSQWWCLRRATVEKVLDFTDRRRDVLRFFRTTWIPDETFFQTLVNHLVPDAEIRRRTLTFLMFTDYGMPVTFHADHEDLLLAQDFLFARKISPDAARLKARLDEVWLDGGRRFEVSGHGRRLYQFLAAQGREGRRFGPRFWERGATLGAERELLIVVAKKWHVGRRLAARLGATARVPHVGYLFSEEGAGMPDLGGIGASLGKRNRHRRAVLGMLYDYHGAERLIICLDPSQIDLIRDFAGDRCTTRVLEVDCPLDDAYLAGHARRIGVLGEVSPPPVVTAVLPAIRAELDREALALREAGFAHFHRVRQGHAAAENAVALAAFLGIAVSDAQAIAGEPHLFED